MSYWSHHPEKYDEIIFEEMVAQGKASWENTEDISEAVSEFMKRPDSWKLASDAEGNYWADQIDHAMSRLDGDR